MKRFGTLNQAPSPYCCKGRALRCRVPCGFWGLGVTRLGFRVSDLLVEDKSSTKSLCFELANVVSLVFRGCKLRGLGPSVSQYASKQVTTTSPHEHPWGLGVTKLGFRVSDLLVEDDNGRVCVCVCVCV